MPFQQLQWHFRTIDTAILIVQSPPAMDKSATSVRPAPTYMTLTGRYTHLLHCPPGLAVLHSSLQVLQILQKEPRWPAVQISVSAILKRKEVDDVLGGEDAWKNVQKTDGEEASLLKDFTSCSLPSHVLQHTANGHIINALIWKLSEWLYKAATMCRRACRLDLGASGFSLALLFS